MLRRVGYSDKMPSVAQSRVLQAWRLERERREQTMDTYTLELVGSALCPWCWCPGSGCHWGHWWCLSGSMAGLAGARSPRPRHWLSSASLHWLTASNGRGRALAVAPSAEDWGGSRELPQEDQYSLARATAKLPASRLPPSSVALPFTGTSGARQSLAVGCTGEHGQMSLTIILGENLDVMMMI